MSFADTAINVQQLFSTNNYSLKSVFLPLFVSSEMTCSASEKVACEDTSNGGQITTNFVEYLTESCII
jgi:hypothetical protein